MNDILLDDNYQPVIQDGDFVAGEDLLQNEKLLLATSKGEWKENPTTGCGVIDEINNESTYDITSEIRRQFKADGILVSSISIVNGEIIIDAKRS